jgi:hypothetical protein
MAAVEDSASRLLRLDRLADLLDTRFRIPGTPIRFGLDGIIGLVPGLGDAAGAVLSLYILIESRAMGASWWAIARMLLNIGIDFLVGLIPILGDIFDIGWKANRRNVALLRRHLARRG